VRKIVLGGIAVALGVSTAVAGGAFAGNPDSNGAQRSGLSPVTNSNPTGDQCQAGPGSSTNGFTIFNAPGRPGATIKFNGEVSLKRGAPNTVYKVFLEPEGSERCKVPAGAITTNEVGNGNAHLAKPGEGAGEYYVVLQDAAGNEQFATGLVTVQ
jgi:hypothetical protein